MPLSTINTVKELASSAQPLILAEVTFASGTVARFSTHDVTYLGHVYQQRLQEQDLQPILSSAQAISALPSVSLRFSDADRQMVNDYEFAEGFKGATLKLTLVMWSVGTTDFTSDSRGVFLGTCDGANVQGNNMVVTARSRNLTRAFFPMVRVQSRCPWPFPSNAAERYEAAFNPKSPFWKCGYSPSNGRGTGSFTTCDYTQDACYARGLLTRSGTKTISAPYAGMNWFPPKNWRSKSYFDKKTVDGTNSGPDDLYGSYFPEGYGTAWVEAKAINSIGEGNSTRGEVVVCVGYVGPNGVQRVIVNDIEVPKNGTGVDPLFRWNYINEGGRDGAPNQDLGFDGNGDPYGSLATIEIVVFRGKVSDDLRRSSIKVLTRFPAIRVYTDPSTYSDAYTENYAWVLMDMLVRTEYDYSGLDIQSFLNAAAICDGTVTYTDLNGVSTTHPRFACSVDLVQRKPANEVIPAILQAFGGYLAPGTDGKVQLYCKGTLAEQQPSAVAGSNYNTAVSSKTRAGVTTNGYLAYLFDEADANILPPGIELSQASIADSPNRIAFEFINKDNGFAKDTMSGVDAQDVGRVGMEVNGSVQVLGINSYDHAKRTFATLSAERLRGNTRGDTGGTLRATLTTTIKGAHLRVGNIVGISSTQYNLTRQPFRISQIKPGKNSETIQLTLDWHSDNWYLDSFGQSPDPGFSNPSKGIPDRPPYPWRPGFVAPQAGDPLYGDEAVFAVTQHYTQAEDGSAIAQIEVDGYLPVNTLSKDIRAPYVPLQGTSASTGGTILGDRRVYVAICATDSNGKRTAPAEPMTVIDVSAGTNTNTVTVPNLRWASGTIGYVVFAGYNPQSMTQQTASAGTPSSITLTAITRTGGGLPDAAFAKLRVDVKPVYVAGAYTGVVVAKPSASVLKIAGAAWTTNAWAGRSVSAYSVGPDGTESKLSNFTVVSNTADELTLDHAASLVVIGDVVVVRTKATTFTSTTIGDSKLAMTTDEHKGDHVRIEFGTGAGQVARIASNTSTVLTIEGQFDTTPDATSVFIVEAAGWTSPSETTAAVVESATVESSVLVDVNNSSGFLIVRGTAIGPDNREAVTSPVRVVWIGGDTGSIAGISIPGDVVAIGANPFNITKTVFTDSNGVQHIELTGEYDPPTPIGSFTGVTLHVDAPDGSGKITAADFDYNGDPAGSGSARYGTFRILMAPPASTTETWRAYLASYSVSYAKPLVLDGDPGETPNRTVSVAPVASLLPVAPALPTLVTGAQFSSRQNAYSELLEAGIRTVITWPTGSTADGVQIYLSRDNGSTWEFVSNNVAVLPGPQTIDDWVDAPSTTLTTCRVKAVPFNEVWNDPDQANSSTAVSAQFTLSAGALVIAGGITNAALVGSITYVKDSAGTWTWGFTVSGTNPTDVNFFTTNFYVQKVDSSGNPVTTDYEGRLRKFTDKDGLGKAWTHTIDSNWTIPPTGSGYKYRVYLYAVNQLYVGAPTIADTFSNPLTTSDPTASLQTSAWGIGFPSHPSYLELAPVEPVGSGGAEYAPVVTGVSASVVYGNDETGAQTAIINGTFTPSADALYGGCNILAHDNGTGREFNLADIPKGGASNVWQSQPIPVPSTATAYDVRFFSYDTSGRANSYSSGTTPHVAVTIQRQSGSSSIEYANLVTGFTAGVRYLTSEDGGQKYVFYGSATAPSDVRFMGANVYACISGTFSANGSTTVTRLTGRQFGAEIVGRTLQIGGVTRTVSSVTNGDTMVLNSSLSTSTYTYIATDTGLKVGYMDLTTMRFTSDSVTVTSDAEIFALYACSFDAAGRVNTIVDGTTPKVSLTVQRSTGSTGTENVALVTGFTAAVRYAYAEDGGQRYAFYGSATAPSDQRWAVADIWAAVSGGLSANGTSTVTRSSGREFGPDLVGKTINIAGVIRTVSSVTDLNTMTLSSSMSAGGWTYIMINDAWKVSYIDRTTTNFTTDYWPVTAISESFVLFAVSADTSGRSNSIVNGTTPSVSLTVARQTGTSGREFADLISSPALDGGAVITINSEIGEQQWFAAGVFTEPSSDPRYGGCKVVRKNTADPDKSIEVADIPRGVSKFRTDFQPSLGVGTILVFLSYDTSGRVNTYQSGTTPELSITVPLQGNTLNLVKATPQSLDTAAFAAGLRPVILVSSLPSLPNSLYPLGTVAFNTSSSSLSKSTGVSWVPMVSGGTDIVAGSITADRLVANSITAGQIQAGAIGTSQLAASEILVGGGGGKPTRFRVNDSLGNMVGFVGDNGAGFIGSYFVNLRVGTNINAPNFYADASQVYLDGVKMTLNLNGVIVKIANEFQQGGFNGFMCYDTSTSNAVVIRPGQFSMHPAITTGTSFSITAGASLNCTLTCYDTGSNAKVRLSANVPGAGGIISVHNGTSLQQGVSGTFVFGTRTVTITGGIITNVV